MFVLLTVFYFDSEVINYNLKFSKIRTRMNCSTREETGQFGSSLNKK